MNIKYETNFVGYLPILRGIQLLLKNKTLNFTQLGAYICFVSQADFDKRHKLYGVILRDDRELAKELSCSPSTINRRRKELVKKGLLVELDGITKVTNFHMFELEWVKVFAKLPVSTLQTLFAKEQDKVEEMDFFVAKMHDKQIQKGSQSSNFPFKGELGLSEQSIQDTIDIEDVFNKLDEEKKTTKN